MPNAFVHIELNTDDVAKAKKFYKSLFKWKLGLMGPGYTGIDVGKGTGGGMQKKAVPESPTLWLPYVQVDDVKKTIAKARKLGANIQLDYMDIEGMGAIGVFVDPAGAPLGVWQTIEKVKAKDGSKGKGSGKGKSKEKGKDKKRTKKKG